MIRTLGILAVLIVGAAAAFSGDDARMRQAVAKADRATIDRIVAAIEDDVEALEKHEWATTQCHTVMMDGNADWQIIGRDAEAILLGRTLLERGYKVLRIVKSRRQKTCDCARPPKDWDGRPFVACAAACFDDPLITVCWP